MAEVLLVKEANKYGGKFVATRSFKDKKVITSGDDIAEVYEAARAKGAKDPVVVYVPRKNEVHVY